MPEYIPNWKKCEKLRRLHLIGEGNRLNFASDRIDRTYKPSSVVDNNLSWPGVAAGLQPPERDRRAAVMPLYGVASGRVYIAARSPGRW